ncbi:hypothetical protein A9174_10430 [Mesorhizobium loti NZP2037]|nr:hypothetical protein [Mesorhizobium loti]ANN57145.1 hypothetical protein A9174_10430 [Mesorhizobium loti NZP2037]
MKKLFLASMVALAATAAVIAPTQAASVIIQSDDGNQYSSDDQSDNGQIVVRRHHRQNYDNQYGDDQSVQYDGNYNGDYRRHRHHRCHIELVKHWRHHHKVIEQVRVCG